MLIELHFLQNYAPSNLNRDDTGSPKEAFFGGIRRARISSQCIKRSIRKNTFFKSELEGYIGTRTRRILSEIEEKLKAKGLNEEKLADILETVKIMFVGGKKSKNKKSKKSKDKKLLETQLIFIDSAETDEIIHLVEEHIKSESDDKKFEDALKNKFKDIKRRSVDIAMFGRMTTGEFIQDVEASVQVAHQL